MTPMTELARLQEENARLRRIIDSFPNRWLETDNPDVVKCMGSVPACAEGGCQLRKRPACGVKHLDTGAVCELPRGHAQKHYGLIGKYRNGSVEWRKDLA